MDYDGNNFIAKFKVALSWLILKAISRCQVYVRKSADKGYHLKCHGLRISFKMSLLVRFLLLEDKQRSVFDLTRTKKPKQILWSCKNGKKAGEWSKYLKKVLF